MNPTILKRLEVIAMATGAAVVVRGAFYLLGVDLELKEAAAMDSVGIIDVLLASVVTGFAAWGVHALIVRARKQRYWPFVGTTVLSISMAGPGYMAGGATAMALMAMHFAVAIPLIIGFAKLEPEHRQHQRGYRSGRTVESR